MSERIVNHVKRMIEEQKEYKALQKELKQTASLEWKLPEPLNSYPWVRAGMSATPYTAVKGADVALSNLELGIKVDPASVLKGIDGDDLSREARIRANEWEKTLGWIVKKAAGRQVGFFQNAMWFNIVQHMMCGQLIHLPTEFKAKSTNPNRQRAMLRMGDWAIRLVDPLYVYAEFSQYGTERVASVFVKTAQQIVDQWPDSSAGKKLAKKIKGNAKEASESYVEVDYVDYSERYVFCVSGNTVDSVSEEKPLVIMEPDPWLTDTEGNPVPFLNWIVVRGNQPLLYPVVKTQTWVNSNIIKTIEQSIAIAEAGAPRESVTGPGADNVQADHGEPGGRINLTPYQKYERIQQLGLDPQLREAEMMIEQSIREATVSDILVTGQPLGGIEAVSGYNLQLQTALASLGPYRATGQAWYSRLLTLMLLISYHRGQDIVGYGDKKYTIDSEEIDPEHIYIDVELKADVPADRVQRITAANQMAQTLQYPIKKILEFLGETDPEGAIREWKIEQYELADWMGRVQRRQVEQSGEIEQMAQQMAMGMMEQQQQQAMSPEQTGALGNAPNLGAPPGMEGVEGQGFNPAQGGTPPIMAGAGATYEGAMGQTRGGQEMA